MANEFKVKKGLIVNGESTVLDILGTQGQLFSVTDDLSGSLFSVNDISGIPIMEVFSDDTIKMGTFGNEAITISGGDVNVGVGSFDASVKLGVNSTTQGFLPPRMTTSQKEAITSPAIGLMVFDTDLNSIEMYDSFWGWMPVGNGNDWKRKWGYEYWNDFGLNNGSNDMVFTTWATNGGGQGVTVNPFPTSLDFIGLQGLRTGVNSNGGSQIKTDVNFGRFMIVGGGKYQFTSRVYIRELSNATDRFIITIGNSLYGSNPTITSGYAFVYDEGGVGTGTLVSPNWQIITAHGGVRSVFDTGVIVSATTFYSFRIEVNTDSTSVDYYINDVLVRTETSNLPPQTVGGVIPIIGITKTAGTTDVGILVDYIGLKKKFVTPR